MARLRLDHDHLELLDAFARTGSLVRAAALLGLTQPALSYRVKEAERRLGVALFVRRSGRPVRLTVAAERLLPTAALVIEEMARAEEDVRRMSEGFHYVVRLGVASRSCFDWLPAFLADFWRFHPEIDVDLAIGLETPVAAALAGHELDVAVTAQADPAQVEVHDLFEEPAVALLARDHPLAERSHVRPADFARYAFVSDEAPPAADPWLRAMLVPAGVTPPRLMASGTPEATVALIAAGAGIGLTGTRRAMQCRETANVVCRPLAKDGFALRWRAAVRAGEGDATPTAFLADRMSYWCQARTADLAPAVGSVTGQPSINCA